MERKTHEIRWFLHRDEAVRYAATQLQGAVVSVNAVPEYVYYDPDLKSGNCEYAVITPMSNRHNEILAWAKSVGNVVTSIDLQMQFSLSDEEAYWIGRSLVDAGKMEVWQAGLVVV